MSKRYLILDTIEKRVKEDSMEARLWAQRLEDLLGSCEVKDIIKEAMTSISWHCTTKGLNLHVATAHLRRTPMTLWATIFRIDHLVKQLRGNPKSLMWHEL
jgi:hypothetical protein